MKKYSYDAVQEGLPKNGFQIMGEIQPKTTGQTQVYWAQIQAPWLA